MVNFVHKGRGYPILLLPGWPSNFTQDCPLIKTLSQKFEVFALNLPGFGYTDPLPEQPSLANLIAFIDNFVSTQNLKKFHLIGTSYGGMLALKYAAAYPQKVHRLIAVAPPVRFSLLPKRIQKNYRFVFKMYRFFPGIGTIIQKAINSDFLFTRLYYLFTDYHYGTQDSLSDLERNKNDVRKMSIHECLKMFAALKGLDICQDCKKIASPTLVLFGLRDSFVGNSPRELKKFIPNIKLVELDCEHWSILNSDTEKDLVNFLK